MLFTFYFLSIQEYGICLSFYYCLHVALHLSVLVVSLHHLLPIILELGQPGLSHTNQVPSVKVFLAAGPETILEGKTHKTRLAI